MALLKDVEIDRRGRVMLAPEICKSLWATHAPTEKALTFKCLFNGLYIVLMPKDGDLLAERKVVLEEFRDTTLDNYLSGLADPQVQLADALTATARIRGSLAAEAISEREERF